MTKKEKEAAKEQAAKGAQSSSNDLLAAAGAGTENTPKPGIEEGSSAAKNEGGPEQGAALSGSEVNPERFENRVKELIELGFTENEGGQCFDIASEGENHWGMLKTEVESFSDEEFKSLLDQLIEKSNQIKANNSSAPDPGNASNGNPFPEEAFPDPEVMIQRLREECPSDEYFQSRLNILKDQTHLLLSAINRASSASANDGFPVYAKDEPSQAKENHEAREKKYGKGYVVAQKGHYQTVFSKKAWESMDGKTDWTPAAKMPKEVVDHYNSNK